MSPGFPHSPAMPPPSGGGIFCSNPLGCDGRDPERLETRDASFTDVLRSASPHGVHPSAMIPAFTMDDRSRGGAQSPRRRDGLRRSGAGSAFFRP